jgi:hypothetical protein
VRPVLDPHGPLEVAHIRGLRLSHTGDLTDRDECSAIGARISGAAAYLTIVRRPELSSRAPVGEEPYGSLGCAN